MIPSDIHMFQDEEAGRSIYQYHFKAWPDPGVPHDPGAILGFVQNVTLHQSNLTTDGVQPGPVVVHSSEGIGRTGTFIVIDILLNLIAFQGEGKCFYVCTYKVLNTWRLCNLHVHVTLLTCTKGFDSEFCVMALIFL